MFAPCKWIRIPKPVKYFLVESGIRENCVCGIWTTGQGIRNPTKDWNPESKFHWQRLEESTWNRESTAWNPESKTILDSFTWSDYVQDYVPTQKAIRRSMNTYPIWCDSPLERPARCSFAPLQKSRRNNRSCVWTEALYPVWFSFRHKSYPVKFEHSSHLTCTSLNITWWLSSQG